LAYVPGALLYFEKQVPWEIMAIFLNSLLGRYGTLESHCEGSTFLQMLSGTGHQLPEDFVIRGLIWAKHYYPHGFFEGQA
jgi:hypothetical protein